MPRKKRIWYPGATYHVMSRGNHRSIIFKEQKDYYEFLEYLAATKKIFSFCVHSLCLMTNHFHMVIETKDHPLSNIMHKLLLSYASNFNNKYSLTGHLFENRYTAKLIEDERYFLEVSRYIHLNPVKAQIVRDSLAYSYSSYGQFVRPWRSLAEQKASKMIGDLVTTDRVLNCFEANRREQYRMFVEGRTSHAEQEKLIQKDMKEDDMWLP